MGIEPTQPAWKAGALPLSYTRVISRARLIMGGAGFEPAKAVPPDLQSGPFGRLGIHPSWVLSSACPDLFQPGPGHAAIHALFCSTELAVRLELTTYGLQNRCSTD